MSTTGNFLFPDDQDDGWITSIQKALPKEKKPDSLEIEDPVAIEAEAAFAKAAAEYAAQETIFAPGWSAEAVSAPPEQPVEDRMPAAALDALDAMVERRFGEDVNFSAVEDPVAAAAEAAFAEFSADNAIQDAIRAAGWDAPAVASKTEPPSEPPTEPPADISPGAAPVESGYSPEALAVLDSIIARESPGRGALKAAEDSVADAAQSSFTETATQEAVFAAGWSAEPVGPGPLAEDMLSPGELAALDEVIAEVSKTTDLFSGIDDPVGFAADAFFAESLAEVAAREAALEAAALDARTAGRPLPEALESLPSLLPSELRALDREIDKQETARDSMAKIDDPVAIEAEAAFAEAAAERAITEAVLAARWAPRTMVAGVEAGRSPEAGFWDFEDLVRAEAEIAFEDAAYDLAYNAVDSLVTGEAVALAAFDQAIASGADPEEALAAAIAAAEAADPAAFMLTRAVARTDPGDDFVFADIATGGNEQNRDDETGEEQEFGTEEETAVATFGEGFNDGPGQDFLFGADGGDALAGLGFEFFFDRALITPPGSGFRRIDRDDLILIPQAVFNTIKGTVDADFLVGGPGRDDIGGLEGNDYIYGDTPTNFDSATHDISNPLTDPEFSSGSGDLISGGDGDDTLYGGAGGDTLYGDDGADRLEGNDGADTLYGGAGADNIFGYAGDDILIGGQGNDTLTGGTGADRFVFEGGSGSGALAHATSLGTDVIEDYSTADGDTFGLSDADFGFGDSGTLTDGTNYFESETATLSAAPLDASGGTAGPAVVILGDGSGTDGVVVYYTDDASAMTTNNSYQIADINGTNTSDIEAGDFNLRA